MAVLTKEQREEDRKECTYTGESNCDGRCACCEFFDDSADDDDSSDDIDMDDEESFDDLDEDDDEDEDEDYDDDEGEDPDLDM